MVVFWFFSLVVRKAVVAAAWKLNWGVKTEKDVNLLLLITLGSRGYFFLYIYTDGQRGAKRREKKITAALSNRKHGLFILGILRTDLWSQGYKLSLRTTKEKNHKRKKPHQKNPPAAQAVDLRVEAACGRTIRTVRGIVMSRDMWYYTFQLIM